MISHGKDIKIFTGNANPALAKEICQIIGTKLGDAEVSGVKRAEQLAERLLGKRKKGAAHNPDTGPNGHSGRHDPQGAAKPRDDGILPPRDRLHGREASDPL